ncbi:hypothetical protein FKM82_011565 [Ascaphus truei]
MFLCLNSKWNFFYIYLFYILNGKSQTKTLQCLKKNKWTFIKIKKTHIASKLDILNKSPTSFLTAGGKWIHY